MLYGWSQDDGKFTGSMRFKSCIRSCPLIFPIFRGARPSPAKMCNPSSTGSEHNLLMIVLHPPVRWQNIDQASAACGGMVSTSELAQFLKEHMPERVEAIADRLTQYKTHATLFTSQTQILSTDCVQRYNEPKRCDNAEREQLGLESTDIEVEEEPTVTLQNKVQYGWISSEDCTVWHWICRLHN